MKLRENQIYHEFISRSWYYIQLLRSVNFTTEHLPEQEGSVWVHGMHRRGGGTVLQWTRRGDEPLSDEGVHECGVGV